MRGRIEFRALASGIPGDARDDQGGDLVAVEAGKTAAIVGHVGVGKRLHSCTPSPAWYDLLKVL